MIKCNKTDVKIKNTNDREVVIYAILNSEAKISLISNVFAKKLKLVSIDVSSYDVMILDRNRLKFYDVYFVRMKIENERDISRFFNESFLEIDLN